MKNFDALIVQRVADIDPKLWELSGQEHPFSSHQWYAFCEKVMPDCSPVHILLFRDGITFARGSFWLMRKDVLPIDSPLGRRAAAWMMKHKPLMVCRSPIANMSGISLPVIGRREALFALTQTAYQYAEKAGVSFVLYDYLSQQEVKPEVLPDGYGYMEIDGPGTALDIHWNSFEDFLSSLSKQAWKDYRRHSNQASKLGIRISIHSSVTDPDEAVDLIRRVEKHHGTMPNPWTEAILAQMNMVGGVWLEARQNGQLVGCGLLLRDGNHLVATLLGLDYDIKYAYFPFIYSAIQWAIENGISVFHAGSGAYELKQRLGFRIEQNNHIAYNGVGPIFATFVRIYSGQYHRRPVEIEEAYEPNG
jgi:predicted N-acyltransferase